MACVFIGFVSNKYPLFAFFQDLVRIETSAKLDERCNKTGPSRLVAGPDSRPRVTVEVLRENQMVAQLASVWKFLQVP